MFAISARIAEDEHGHPVGVGCFDPTIVIGRLRRTFPNEVVVCIHDYAWKDYDFFVQRSFISALDIAERDARRRGPIFHFRMRARDDQVIHGRAERYLVTIWS